MRYLVFTGEIYEPNGGGHDFAKGFEDLEEAVSFCKTIIRKDVDESSSVGGVLETLSFANIKNTYRWVHIFDAVTGKVILESKNGEDLKGL